MESEEQEGSERDSGEDEDESEEEGEEEDEGAAIPQKPVQKRAVEVQKAVAEQSVQKKSAQNPATSQKAIDRYADEGGAVSKREKRVGKPGRWDHHEEFVYGGVKNEEFVYGGVKKRRAPPVKYAEEEEEWEDEDVVALSDEAEAEEDKETRAFCFRNTMW